MGMIGMATILLAEDDAHTTRVMQLWLTRHKHVVIEAGDGQAALDKLRVTPVDLLISDVNMPRMTGLQLVHAVRTELRLDLPILMFSSRCDHAELAREVGPLSVQLYPKPFVPSRLCAHIDRLLAERNPGGAPVASCPLLVDSACADPSAAQPVETNQAQAAGTGRSSS